jgi:hypothetical protein
MTKSAKALIAYAEAKGKEVKTYTDSMGTPYFWLNWSRGVWYVFHDDKRGVFFSYRYSQNTRKTEKCTGGAFEKGLKILEDSGAVKIAHYFNS